MHQCTSDTHTVYRGLRVWFDSEPGRTLFKAESEQVSEWLPGLFGYHLLSVPGIDPEFVQSSRIRHQVTCAPDVSVNDVSVISDYGPLPFRAESIDVVVLHHALEFSSQPHLLLREAEQILVPEGHLIIVSFNPMSLYGLWKAFGPRAAPPWCGHFYRESRIRDWLELLGFKVLERRGCCFRPPLARSNVMERLSFLENVGARLWPFMSGAYLLLAQKHMIAMTPEIPRWRHTRNVVANGLVEPTRRTGSSI